MEQPNATHLRSIIDKLERLEEERADVAERTKNVLAEAQGLGFDPKVVKRVLKVRNMKAEDREKEELLTLYLNVLGY